MGEPMDRLRILMYILSMTFFRGVRIAQAAGSSGYTAWLDLRPDQYSLQYHHDGGPIDLVVDDEPAVRLAGPVAWLTYPGHRFRYGRQDGATWTHYYLVFGGPRVREYIQTGLYPLSLHPPVVTVRDPDWFFDAFNRVIAYAHAGHSRLPWAIHGLEGLLLHLQEGRANASREHRLRGALLEIRDAIRQHPGRDWDFGAQAARLGISYAHFRRTFRQCAGVAPQQAVIAARLERAAWLLRHTRMPVKSVATETGIDDPYHFSKLFATRYRMPPSRYRQEVHF